MSRPGEGRPGLAGLRTALDQVIPHKQDNYFRFLVPPHPSSGGPQAQWPLSGSVLFRPLCDNPAQPGREVSPSVGPSHHAAGKLGRLCLLEQRAALSFRSFQMGPTLPNLEYARRTSSHTTPNCCAPAPEVPAFDKTAPLFLSLSLLHNEIVLRNSQEQRALARDEEI